MRENQAARSERLRRLPWPCIDALILGGLFMTLFVETVVETALFVAENLLFVAPIVIFAILLSSAIRASGADGLITRAFEGRTLAMIAAASALGAITPVCGIGVLPIIAGLLAGGVPLAPIMAFWLSSPITDPAMLTVTAGLLGLPFAIGKTAIAFGIGLFGGFATLAVTARGGFALAARADGGVGVAAGSGAGADAACCGPLTVMWPFWRDTARRRQFLVEARGTAWLMLKWLTIAFALEGLLRSYLPPELIVDFVGGDTPWAIPIAVTIGAPIYLDGYASLPLVRGLIELGMAPGAAMAFMVAGGITSLYASVAVWALVSRTVFVWYVSLAVVGSALGGWAYGLAVA
jgi:uncharacterized membrane protein YraQ (UPF0718 family)